MPLRLDVESKRRDMVLLRPCHIAADHKRNSRWRADEDVSELVESFLREGQIEPVIVHLADGKPILDVGYRRLLAAQQVYEADPAFRIKALVVDYDESFLFRLNLAENVKRKNLSPMSLCKAVQRLFDEGASLAEIQTLMSPTGKPMSESWVSHVRRLTELPAEQQEALEADELPLGAAFDLLGANGAVQQAVLASLPAGKVKRTAVKAALRSAGGKSHSRTSGEVKATLAEMPLRNAAQRRFADALIEYLEGKSTDRQLGNAFDKYVKAKV